MQVAGTLSSEAAFQLLSKYRIESDDFMFWGSEGPDSHRDSKLVDDQVHLLPNPVLCCQSLSGRATAMALMTYTRRREMLKEPIVNWLHSRRHGHSDWGDSVSTALATQALMEYAIGEGGTEDTSLGVRLDFVDYGSQKKTTKLLTVNQWEMGPHPVTEFFSDIGGHVTVTVQGQGRAVLQLSQEYTLDDTESLPESPVTAYQLQLQVTNSSDIVYLKTCQTWLCPYQTGYSGPSTVMVTLPSGFTVTEDMVDLNRFEGVTSMTLQDNVVYFHYNYVRRKMTLNI